jgi:hypothetical protein
VRQKAIEEETEEEEAASEEEEEEEQEEETDAGGTPATRADKMSATQKLRHGK